MKSNRVNPPYRASLCSRWSHWSGKSQDRHCWHGQPKQLNTHFPHATTMTMYAEEQGTMPNNILRGWLILDLITVHLLSVQYNYKTASITDLTPSLMNKALDTFLDWASKLKGCTGSSMSGSCINCWYTLNFIFLVAIIPSGTLPLLVTSIYSWFTLHYRRKTWHEV